MKNNPILKISDGLIFSCEDKEYFLPPVRLFANQWALFAPEKINPSFDLPRILAQLLLNLEFPIRGSIEVLGKNIHHLPYKEIQLLRSKIGFIQGYGGLLSNKTVKENISLPVNIHKVFLPEKEELVINETLKKFKLEDVADLKPHLLDGYTRWRVAMARALILEPSFLVLEGIGDWDLDSGQAIAWQRLIEYNKRGTNVICICTSRRNKDFENWFTKQNGIIFLYEEKNSSQKVTN